MTCVFAVGYIIIWGGFAVFAASLQMALAETALLSPSLTLVSARVGGATFLAAAIYEFSPIKNRCLTQCINPLQFVTSHWRPGLEGALRMGIIHGAFCLGCCWVLMLLLFAAGVMNLIWVAVLATLRSIAKGAAKWAHDHYGDWHGDARYWSNSPPALAPGTACPVR